MASRQGRPVGTNQHSEPVYRQDDTVHTRPDRAPLVNLFAALLPIVDPNNQWQEATPAGAAARRAVMRGLARAVERLACGTSDAGLFSPGDVEGMVDKLLHDAGTAAPGSSRYTQRWAAETRRHLGMLGPLLIDMHRTRQQWLRQGCPAVEHPADNLNFGLGVMERLLASARLEAAAIKAQGGEPPANKLDRLEQVEAALKQLMRAGEPAPNTTHEEHR